MPFLDSNTIRPLYDVHDGGPPVGFKCMLDVEVLLTRDIGSETWYSNGKTCPRVTRTLRGMQMHQKRVHRFEPQQELNFDQLQVRGK